MTVPAHASNTANFPELHERWLVGSFFQPWAETSSIACISPPATACWTWPAGTGIVARLALRRLSGDGRVVGGDVSQQTLTVPQATETGIPVSPTSGWRAWRTIVFSNPAMFVRFNSNALVGMGAASSKMADSERTKLSELPAADSPDVVQRYMDAERLTLELGANGATAHAGRSDGQDTSSADQCG